MGGERPYLFGDDGAAARRLAMVAQMYEPTSRAFLQSAVRHPVQRALDLGCGPGHTTALLAQAVAAEITVGLDASESFVAEARRRQGRPGVLFAVSDVTAPLPMTGVEVIYSRLLLAHLRDVPTAVRRWLSALSPGGAVLLEEVASVDATESVFREYLEALTSLMRHKGTELLVGSALAGIATASGGTLTVDRSVDVAPTTGHVARMFSANLPSWRAEAISRSVWDQAAADAVAAGLAMLAEDEDPGRITWRMRQVAVSPTRR